MPRTSCLVSCCLAAACCHAALADWPTGLAPDIVATLYVDDDAPPGGDGLSWATAFDSLHDALDAAALIPTTPVGLDTVQIRMGGGVYVPERRVDPDDPRTAIFQVGGSRIEVAGGFAGFGAPDPDLRDRLLYETVLSGDIRGDDESGFVNRGDNAYHVVAQRAPAGQFLSGVTIRGGNATDVPEYHPDLGFSAGGGIIFGGVSLSDCLITECEADHGGAMGPYEFLAVATGIYDCVFLHNRARINGGALGTTLFSNATFNLNRTRFLSNTAPLGGAVYSGGRFGNTGVRSFGCEFSGNRAEGESLATTAGGAVFLAKHIGNQSARFTQCTFANNCAPRGLGGAVASAESSVFFTNCAIAYNSDILGSGVDAQVAGAFSRFSSCAVDGIVIDAPYFIQSPSGFFTPTIGEDPMFADPLGPDGIAGSLDDDLRPAAGSPLIDAGAGNQIAIGNPGQVTIGGEARIVDDPTRPNISDPGALYYHGPIDIGAYEYQRDDDGDGTLDSVQIVGDPSLDCDGNGVLDAFEAFSDCDNNGINDRCQIADDPSLDLNWNRILDSCDIASGTSEDENSNGIPDENEPALRFVNGSRVIGSGDEDGRSWATAYASLDAALEEAAARLAPTEVWVAGGVYTPTGFGEGRSRAFHVRGDTTLLGGFAGDEESADQRDPVANPTILSGDFNQDDTDGGTNEENALHVVIGPRFGEHAILDGFVVERGNANQVDDGLLTVYQTGLGVWPDATGGGVLSVAGEMTLRDCVIRDHFAGRGGAAVHVGPCALWESANIEVARLALERCSVQDNTAAFPFATPGASGIYGVCRTDIRVGSCLFTDNRIGSAIVTSGRINGQVPSTFTDPYSLEIINSLFVGNESTYESGGMPSMIQSFVHTGPLQFNITNSTISHNTGRGVSVPAGGVLANSIIWGNTGDSGATETDQVSINATGSVRNTIVEGWTGTLPGTHVSVSGADPMFADALSGDLRLLPGSPAIDAGDNNPLALAVLDDLDGNDRFVNDCATPDTGVPDGLRPLVDLGVYEFQAASIMGDANGDGVVDVTDLNLVLSAWMTSVDTPGLGGDVSRDGFVDMDDLNQVLGAWGQSCE